VCLAVHDVLPPPRLLLQQSTRKALGGVGRLLPVGVERQFLFDSGAVPNIAHDDDASGAVVVDRIGKILGGRRIDRIFK